MIHALFGFLFGLFIPCIARRFAKFMPATFAYALWKIILLGKLPSLKPQDRSRKLWCKYLCRSAFFGLLCGTLSFAAQQHFGNDGIWFHLFFIWILLLLAEIDARTLLLPDILTIPLLLTGLLASCLNFGFIILQDSVIAAFIGYFLPTAASLLFVWKNKEAFGGGDVKLLSALGAWLGLEGLLYTIVLSCISFMIFALFKRSRSGAYGPALSFAAIIVAFWYF